MPNSLSASSGHGLDWEAESPMIRSLTHSHIRLECRFTREEPEEAEQLLESFKPHIYLGELTIDSYNGAKFPDWLGDPSFTRLTSVDLINCGGICDCLPPSLGLLPALTSLTITRLSVREFHDRGRAKDEAPRYPNLQRLTLIDMLDWEVWQGFEEDDFPKLFQLRLTRCPELREVPRFGSLRVLSMTSCHSLTSLPALPSLRNMSLIDCVSLVELPHMPQLSKLWVSGCKELTSIVFLSHDFSTFVAWMDQLLSLDSLIVENCPELRSPLNDEKLPPYFNKETLKAWHPRELTSSTAAIPEGRKKSWNSKIHIISRMLKAIFQMK